MKVDLKKRIDELENRLKMLEEERAILSTLYAYGHTIDYGLKAEWLDCFTEDAIYKVQVLGVTIPKLNAVAQPTTGLKGREVLSQYFAGHTHAPDMWHKHCLVEPIVRLEDNNKATVDSYFARLDEDENGAYIMTFGRYRDKLVKCEDDKWRFVERICETESRLPNRVQRPTK